MTEVWLQVIHNKPPTYAVPFVRLWHLVAAIEYYILDLSLLQDWFEGWYDNIDISSLPERELLYPTWRFDHAGGFAECTRHLAYAETGHLTEENPSPLNELHLPKCVIRTSMSESRGVS